ncbi:AI-2E family transporter [Methylolobus aquaticus]
MNRTFRLITVGLLLSGLLALTYVVIRPFILPVAWAVIISYVAWPFYRWIRQAVTRQRTAAALLTTVALASILLAPFIWLTVLLQHELVDLVGVLPEWLEQKPVVPPFVSRLPYIGNQLTALFEPFDDLRGLLKEHGIPWLKRLGTPALGVMTDIGQNALVLILTLFTMFFLFRDGAVVVEQVRAVFDPVLGERTKGYLHTIETTVKAVVYGIVLTALAQGAIAGIGYWLVGVKAPILLAIITTLFAMIPFGTPFVWVAASAWLLIHGETWAGISLLLWGALVVSWVDNIIRPLVISSSTRIPFVLVMFGVLGGLAAFGFIGLFTGPVILAMALAVWREWLQAHHVPTG